MADKELEVIGDAIRAGLGDDEKWLADKADKFDPEEDAAETDEAEAEEKPTA
jgi:hypothetical protein